MYFKEKTGLQMRKPAFGGFSLSHLGEFAFSGPRRGGSYILYQIPLDLSRAIDKPIIEYYGRNDIIYQVGVEVPAAGGKNMVQAQVEPRLYAPPERIDRTGAHAEAETGTGI